MRSLIILSFLWISLLGIQTALHAQTLFIDEQFDEWTNLIEDPTGDNAFGTDFIACAASTSQNRIFFYLKLHTPLLLQAQDDVALYIDLDDNVATGRMKNGIGADLVYYFSDRYGIVYEQNGSRFIDHEDIYLVHQPSVRANQFEIGINRDIQLNGSSFTVQNFRYLFVSAGDQIPNGNGGISYTATMEIVDPPNIRYSKDPRDIRICSYNVHFDDLFVSTKQPSFLRIFAAIQADVWAIQEVYDHSDQEIADLIRVAQNIPVSQELYHASAGHDVHIISKYPVQAAHSIAGNGAFHLQLPISTDEQVVDVLIINAHLPCCERDQERQDEIDQILKFIRNQKSGIGPFDMEGEFPIVVVGDMNFVGSDQNPYSLIHGEIANNNLYGPNFNPGWNDKSFNDIKAPASGTHNSCTWSSEESSYSPSRIDYILYTGGRMRARNSFVLNVAKMSAADRNQLNLLSLDGENASDHYPIVADVRIRDDWSGTENPTWSASIQFKEDDQYIYLVYNGLTDHLFDFQIIQIGSGQRSIYGHLEPQNKLIQIDKSTFSQGCYTLTIRSQMDGSFWNKKFIIY